MKPIYIVLLCAIAFASKTKGATINYLNTEFYGIEDGGSAFFMQHSEWSVTSEKTFEGNYALKFSSDSEVNGQKKAQGGSNGAGISLPVGEYTLKIKLWVEQSSTFTDLNFSLKSPWKNIVIPVSDLEKEKWVEVEIPFALTEEAVASGSILKVTSGSGTFYLDNIEIWGEGEEIIEPEKIPLTSMYSSTDANSLSLPRGKYKMSVKVYLPSETTITKFHTQIKEPWMAQEWELSAIATDQWITLSKELLLPTDLDKVPFGIFISNHPNYGGGKGELFIDDIRFDWDDIPSEIETPLGSEMTVYPNPTTDYLRFKSTNSGQLRLFSSHGKVVKTINYNANQEQTISLNNVSAGIYLLQLVSTNGSEVRKVVVR